MPRRETIARTSERRIASEKGVERTRIVSPTLEGPQQHAALTRRRNQSSQSRKLRGAPHYFVGCHPSSAASTMPASGVASTTPPSELPSFWPASEVPDDPEEPDEPAASSFGSGVEPASVADTDPVSVAVHAAAAAPKAIPPAMTAWNRRDLTLGSFHHGRGRASRTIRSRTRGLLLGARCLLCRGLLRWSSGFLLR
jgi:hypothetical protein